MFFFGTRAGSSRYDEIDEVLYARPPRQPQQGVQMSSTTGTMPRIRPGVHARCMGDEVVVVDEHGGQAHVLRGPAAAAWVVAAAAGDAPSLLTADVLEGLQELDALGLLQVSGSSRRAFLRQASTVAVGASIITIGLPSVASAHSGQPANSHVVPSFSLAPASVAFSGTTLSATITATLSAATGHPAPAGTVALHRVVNGVREATARATGTLSGGTALIPVTSTTVPNGTYVGVYTCTDTVYVSGRTSDNTVAVSGSLAPLAAPTISMSWSPPRNSGAATYSTATVTVTGASGAAQGDWVTLSLTNATLKAGEAARKQLSADGTASWLATPAGNAKQNGNIGGGDDFIQVDLDGDGVLFRGPRRHLAAAGWLELQCAATTTPFCAVHASVVSWRGRAIVCPGRSMSGKTTLCAALVRAGAKYLSDEFALVDPSGLIHPYPRRPRVRPTDGGIASSAAISPAQFSNWPVGSACHVGAVLALDVRSREPLLVMSAAESALALIDNAVPAQLRPAFTLACCTAAVGHADVTGWRGQRRDADLMAVELLARLNELWG
jgi:hypothetical protein